MNEKGFTNTAALLGGTAAWEKAGYPMESAEPAKSDNKNSGAGKKPTTSNTSHLPTDAAPSNLKQPT